MRVINVLTKNIENRNQIEFVSLEQMVPQDHLLRQIDTAIDFHKIYEFVGDLYCKDNGRPSIDPVVLFKIVLIQHIYGICSLRRTLEEINMNMAYRWFIGYPLNEQVPHFSTVSYNFKHRFNTASVEYIFRWVLKAAADEGYLDTEAIFVDGTHIKASANLKKQARKAVPKEAKRYAHELFDEINKDREAHGKKPFDENNNGNDSGSGDNSGEPEMVEKTVSTTDPECGVFHKGEHKKVFAYEAHTACDKHNFILGVHVTPGNIHDSVAFDPLYDDICQHYPEHKIVAADSAYKTPWICKRIFESGRVLTSAYTRPKTKDGNHPWYNAICNASWLRPDQFIGIGIFANACPDTTSPVIETARLRIGHPQASKRVKPQIRVIDTAFRIRVFHDCGAGTEGSAIIIADTQHHNVAAYLCVLTAVKVDKNASGRADFNGGNPLPAAVCVLKAFLRCVYINISGRKRTLILHMVNPFSNNISLITDEL